MLHDMFILILKEVRHSYYGCHIHLCYCTVVENKENCSHFLSIMNGLKHGRFIFPNVESVN